MCIATNSYGLHYKQKYYNYKQKNYICCVAKRCCMLHNKIVVRAINSFCSEVGLLDYQY